MNLIKYVPMLLIIVLSGCEQNDPVIYTNIETQGGIKKMKKLAVMSAAFEDGGTIPQKYTCEGADISPAISWNNIPEGTRTLALICDDPDAPMGTWVHWIVFNIPASVSGFPEAVDVENEFGAVIGTNSWGKQSYGGPCPPSGNHRYYFKIYALDRTLELTERANKEDLLDAMKEAILAEGQIMGHYQRIKH